MLLNVVLRAAGVMWALRISILRRDFGIIFRSVYVSAGDLQ